jgi:hypothetical protein
MIAIAIVQKCATLKRVMPRSALKKIILEHPDLALEVKFLTDSFFEDYFPESNSEEKRYVSAILMAQIHIAPQMLGSQGIDLTKSQNIESPDILFPRLTRVLIDSTGLPDELAVYAVSAWAEALEIAMNWHPAATPHSPPKGDSVEFLMKRGHLFLKGTSWQQATEYFDRVLDIDPKYTPAYIGKLCAELEVQNEESLGDYVYEDPISEYYNFYEAVHYADDKYLATLERYVIKNIESIKAEEEGVVWEENEEEDWDEEEDEEEDEEWEEYDDEDWEEEE